MEEFAHCSIPSNQIVPGTKKALSKYLLSKRRKQQDNLDIALNKGSVCFQLTPFLLQSGAEWVL